MTAESDDRRAGRVTHALAALRAGHDGALEQLFPLVYDELRRIARRQLRGGAAGRTLDATGLVHELYLRVAGRTALPWQSRAHFYAVAARAMRQILINHAQRRLAQKRGGDWVRTTLSHGEAPVGIDPEELLALDQALGGLDERRRQIVEYRFFCGMSDREIAELLGVSTRTVEREWARARAWLYRALYLGSCDGGLNGSARPPGRGTPGSAA